MTYEPVADSRTEIAREFARREGITVAVAIAILKNADDDIARAKAALAKMRG